MQFMFFTEHFKVTDHHDEQELTRCNYLFHFISCSNTHSRVWNDRALCMGKPRGNYLKQAVMNGYGGIYVGTVAIIQG